MRVLIRSLNRLRVELILFWIQLLIRDVGDLRAVRRDRDIVGVVRVEALVFREEIRESLDVSERRGGPE